MHEDVSESGAWDLSKPAWFRHAADNVHDVIKKALDCQTPAKVGSAGARQRKLSFSGEVALDTLLPDLQKFGEDICAGCERLALELLVLFSAEVCKTSFNQWDSDGHG